MSRNASLRPKTGRAMPAALFLHSMLPQRKIIHIDMDAFYASVEQRDFPEYRGRPLVVGGSPEGRGGVVATASYEARRFGIRSAMPAREALQRCPQAIFVRPRFAVYKEVSTHIRGIFHRYTDLVEPLSLDEAYLDVSTDKEGIGSAIEIARRIRQAIREELQLTASAGVSISKFVAKVASDMNKPDGLTFIAPAQVEAFMESLAVGKFHGVGRVTAAKMAGMNIHTGADLKALSEEELVQHFGKSGRFYYRIVRGIDEREVRPHRETKSAGAEDTFPQDLTTLAEMNDELDKLAGLVQERLQKKSLKGRTVTVKVKFKDFRLITRSRSLPAPMNDAAQIGEVARAILQASDVDGKPVRLLGISLSNFGDEPMLQPNKNGQLQLF